MNRDDALALLRRHGVLLVSAAGPVPKLTEAIAGETIKGSWWGHPKGKQIFPVLEAVCAHADVLVCRLIDDKLTLVHRRLWPALAAAAGQFPAARLCRVSQQHTAGGRHRNLETAFADWLPADAAAAARDLSLADALAALGPWASPS
ncbi:MAG: hypothetical protein QFF03_13610 [Pseudomonadota bacterium]|nr:hypothetical protein [Pseudomonadota bacterium]